ncbi:MAG: restriction endonuclease subunit S [Syntrophobacteraceae bacterium]
MRRLKSVANIRYGLGQPPAELSAGVAVIRATDVDAGTIRTTNLLRVDPALLPLSRNPCLKTGEIIVVRSGAYTGDSAIVPSALEGAVAGYDLVATVTRASPQFVAYGLLSKYVLEDHIQLLTLRAAQPHLNAEELGSVTLAIPPSLSEQERISAYLDASCAAIDASVDAKRRQIETLDTLILSTIQHAVTRGLDAKVKMKPTQLDWLPEVPSHWTVQQIKRRCDLLRGKFSHRPRNDPALYDGEYPFVQTGDITAAEKYICRYSQTLNELGFRVSKMFPKGTLVMSIAANVGDVAILDFEACFPDSMVGLVPDHHTSLDFLFYLMWAMKGILLRSAVLTTQLNLNYVRIGTNFAAFPPRRDQEAIAAFIDAKSADVRATKDVLHRQIETLVAYRKSLVHECVTGQRRVTEADVRRAQNVCTVE